MSRTAVLSSFALVIGLSAGFVVGRVVAPAVPETDVREASAAAGADAEPADDAPTRTRVRPTEPEPVPETTEEPAADESSSDPLPDVSTDDLLARVHAYLTGDETVDVTDIGEALAVRGQAQLLDLDSAMALLRAGDQAGWDTVSWAQDAWPDQRLLDLIGAGLASSDPDDRVAGMSVPCAHTLLNRGVPVSGELVRSLIAADDGSRREAGIVLARGLDSPPLDALERVAGGSSDPSLRSSALGLVASVLTGNGTDTLDARGAALIRAALDDDAPQVRQTALEWLPTLPDNGDAAIRLAREEGLSADEQWSVLHAVLRSGRIDDFMASSPSPELIEHLGMVIHETDDDGEMLRQVLPHIDRILVGMSPDWSAGLVWSLAHVAGVDTFERIARNDGIDKHARLNAVEVLLEPEDEPTPESDARRKSGAALFFELTDPGRADAALRRLVMDELTYYMWDDDDPVAPLIERAVRRAAETDPNSWVRATAATAIRDFDAR